MLDRQTGGGRKGDNSENRKRALRRGVDPATLASALVKADAAPARAGAAFVSAADRRLESLLAAAAGETRIVAPRLPFEWLPPAAVATLALACHLSGLAV